MERIYLDHNATTPMRAEVRARFLAALDEVSGNPSSLHDSGRRARHLLDDARQRVAATLAVDEDEIVFTSGGTEANNLALFGVLHDGADRRALAVGATEHSSVLGPARELERRGHGLHVLPVDSTGTIELETLTELAKRSELALVSVMAANNEIGTLAPLADIRPRLPAGAKAPLFHSDAVQALGRAALDLRGWGIDLASFSAHKLGGPLGVGVLFKRRALELRPLMFGGEQEGALRPGTENVAAISAAALAIELAVRERASLEERLRRLSMELWKELGQRLSDVRLIGLPLDHARRLPGTLNMLTHTHDGKVLVMRLDLEGLECSAGSACASGSLEPSHVLLALGHVAEEARAGLRVSLGRSSTWSDVRKAVDILGRTLGATNAKRDERSGL